jgi:chloramphenicol 3-O-phosphotransferase
MDWDRVEKARLVIVRGLPGSGKSTLARELKALGFMHFENDMWFEREGGYKYDSADVGAGQRWCYDCARFALIAGRKVVVSNVFSRLDHMKEFLALDVNAIVIEMTGAHGNVHEVPEEKILEMRSTWEAFDGAIAV